jgi:hypothetical protein
MPDEDKARLLSPYDLRRILGDADTAGIKLLGKKSDGTFENIKSDDNGRLQTYDPKVASLVSYTGTTTADGAPGGGTLICTGLTAKPDYNGNTVVITSSTYQGQTRGINGTTLAGTVTADSNFGGQILTGTEFAILSIRWADIAAVIALLNTIITDVGFEGATSLADKLTLARATLLDRLSLLAAGGAGELTPARAALLSNLDAAITSRAAPGDAMALTAATTLIIQALILSDATPFPGADIALIKTQTDKLAGQATVANAVVANWQAAETNLVTIGANGVSNKLHLLIVDISTLVGNISIRVYHRVNGVERRIFPIPANTTFTAAASAPAIPVVDTTMAITEALRITIQSDNAVDNGQSVAYEYKLEAM